MGDEMMGFAQHTLHPEDRSILHRSIVRARELAEEGVRAALSAFAVGQPAPFEGMTEDQRTLRNALRAHARQLGDRREKSGSMTMDALVREGAYEHWHRMLFARFLAENGLLQHPTYKSQISLEECKDLAESEGFGDAWEAAAQYATAMLPQIFRVDSPVFRIRLAPEHQVALERLIENLPPDVFTAADSLGWVYQFWQTARKQEVNASEVKIGAEELPAVTQLFTEDYMVQFLLDNSLGAWWANQRLKEEDLQQAASEAVLRELLALPGVPFGYLRFVRDTEDHWTPAGSRHAAWSESLADFRLLDPCCGSGHFLVAAFRMLVPMRIEREQISTREAVDRVLMENIHGLELDQRCVELAAFNLALAAWTTPDAGGYRKLPDMNIACSGQRIRASKQQWLGLAHRMADELMQNPESDLFPEASEETIWHTELKGAMNVLYDLFEDAPVLGSLIDPRRMECGLFSADYDSISPLLQEALHSERLQGEEQEMGVAAEGIACAAQMLAGKYHLVITNVPYLVRSRQDEVLRSYCEAYSPEAKNDLATTFLERCLELCHAGGNCSIVLPQNWLFLTSYRTFREKLLRTRSWDLIARLGARAFEMVSGEVVNAILLSISLSPLGGKHETESPNATEHMMRGLDVSEQRSPDEKAKHLRTGSISVVRQDLQLSNPDAIVALELDSATELLGEACASIQGLATADDPQFKLMFWESGIDLKMWVPLMGSVSQVDMFAGRETILRWENGTGKYHEHALRLKAEGRLGGWKSGREAWNRKGVSVSEMSSLPCTIYMGEMFDHCAHAIIPFDQEQLPAIFCFVASPDFSRLVREINQKLNVTNNTLVKIHYDKNKWREVGQTKYPNGLPLPYSNDPTQWIFHGHPCGSVIWDEQSKLTTEGPLRMDATVLQISVARLLGYRWPAELGAEMELADEQRALLKRCDDLHRFADDDGIVCIPSVRSERTAAERLVEFLAEAFGDAWTSGTLHTLLASVGSAGKSIDQWLRDSYFEHHCMLFGHRPFIWHIWDGRRHDGFHALLNYHKLAAGEGKGRKVLESLTYSYLGDWIGRREADVKRGEDGAEERLAAAKELRRRLESILKGEEPFDIFVRWKPLREQAVGWDPDINDGVRMNIRPFMASDIPGGRVGAGILRWKPNIKWTNDRGKEPERPCADYPWFWAGDSFKGERVNDVHLTIEEKLNARGSENENGA